MNPPGSTGNCMAGAAAKATPARMRLSYAWTTIYFGGMPPVLRDLSRQITLSNPARCRIGQQA
jgi:hypothetical protein